jgi:hypothetical protein
VGEGEHGSNGRAADPRSAGMTAAVPGQRDMDIKGRLTHNAPDIPG